MMLLHVSSYSWYSVPVTSIQWQEFNVYDSLVRFCVPVFVMVSGAFFLDANRTYTLKKLFKHNILRIITAYIFWSAAYAIYTNLLQFKTINHTVIINIIKSFLVGHFHLWFLFTLVCIYLIVPFLRKICENKKLEQYFLLLFFIFTLCFNLLTSFIQKPLITAILKNMNFYFPLGYAGYFVLGHYLVHYTIKAKHEWIIYLTGVLSVIFTILITYSLSVGKHSAQNTLYNYLLPSTCFEAMAVFTFFKNRVSKLKLSGKATSLALLMSKLSFGMYLVHDFFRTIFARSGLAPLSFHPVYSVPVITLCVFAASFSFAWIIHKIPVLKKYII
jgi:surface polysaccharide O-acyltransferase-like enzyme